MPLTATLARARVESLVRYLDRHVAGEVRFDEVSRRLYATDASHYQIVPLGVVVPKTVDDLTATVQIASELNVPITARGGGTSLTGQSIGPGIVIDCSKYLNRIGELDAVGGTVTVQPGVVLDHLNRHLAGRGWMFGPDVATANRATLGGMIGNNSAGSHSVVYGQTVDHVRSLTTILGDGTSATFGPLTERECERKRELRTREGAAYRAAHAVVREHGDEIEKRFPKIVRKVSGYNLSGIRQRPHSLVPLVVGSEGTLAVIAEAELSLVPRPKFRGLLVPHFATLQSALDAVGACLELGPSAVEMMDQMLIDLAREQLALRRTMAAIHGRPAALLMAEFTGDSSAEVEDKIAKLARRLDGIAGMTACVTAIEPALRDPLWNLRSAAVPLLGGMPGDRKPVTFVEDCAVDPKRMPEFAARFREVLHRHGTDGAFYGHASVGCLHIRPVLNIHDPADLATMRKITEAVTDLVLEFEGSLSGEHGDGLTRSEWNRKMFGPTIYEAFRTVKRAFDPENVLNPNKIVDGPAMEANLRQPPGQPLPEPPAVFDYATHGGYFRSVELCNGAGVCRKTQSGAMCPSYRATKDERDTPRGRANALRFLSNSEFGTRNSESKSGFHSAIRNPQSAFAEQRWTRDVMDLCLSCKACKAECPSNVDIAKLKAEFTEAYYSTRKRPLGHLLLKYVDVLSPMAARMAGLANWTARRKFARRMIEALAGIDHRRTLPEFHRDHFRRWFARRPRKTGKRVLLLDDCFTTFQEPHLGRAAVELLESLGFAVELAGICCGRAMLSKGFVSATRDLARREVPRLARRIADGTPILGLEPSCQLTLADEWPDLVPGPAAKAIATAVESVEAFAVRAARDTGVSLAPQVGPVTFHPHCHQRALVGPASTTDALAAIPGTALTTLDAGCCGMAGAFGYEKEHYDLSLKIAGLQLLPALAAAPDATVVATGTSCRHQIRDTTGRIALHPVELLRVADSVTSSPAAPSP